MQGEYGQFCFHHSCRENTVSSASITHAGRIRSVLLPSLMQGEYGQFCFHHSCRENTVSSASITHAGRIRSVLLPSLMQFFFTMCVYVVSCFPLRGPYIVNKAYLIAELFFIVIIEQIALAIKTKLGLVEI